MDELSAVRVRVRVRVRAHLRQGREVCERWRLVGYGHLFDIDVDVDVDVEGLDARALAAHLGEVQQAVLADLPS